MEAARAVRLTQGRWARVALAVVAVLVLVGVATYLTQAGSAPAATTRATTKASVGDVMVTIGGVGRIVPASSAPVAKDAGGGSSSASGGPGGTAAPAPSDAVFARASGKVSRVLVRPGRSVVAGQAIAVIDDDGAAATIVRKASDDLATANLELARMRDPLTPADASSLALDIRRAQADLETLRGGTSADRSRALRVARRSLVQARSQLRLVRHPRTAADMAAAQAEVRKAESELSMLTNPPVPPSLAAVTAARAAVVSARAALTRVSGAPDPVALAAARLEVARADNELALLVAQEPPATATEIAASRAARDVAAAQLSRLLGPPDPADVTAAETELRKVEADLDTLLAPPPPTSALSVATARAALAAARSRLGSLRRPPPRADVATARLELARAHSDLSALRRGPDPAALAAARTAITTAQTRLSTPTSPLDVELARVRVAGAAAALSAARLGEDLLIVRAFADGTVTGVTSRRGIPVDPTTPIATVSDLTRLAVDVDVSEFDAAQVQQGMAAILSVDALGGKSYPGNVRYATPVGSDAAGVVTFPVRISLSRAEGLKAGMNVSVRIVVEERQDVVRVPLEAVQRKSGGRAQIRVLGAGGTVTLRTVELGLADNNVVEVVDGIRAGERVVLATSSGGGGE